MLEGLRVLQIRQGSKWFTLVWLIPSGIILLVIAVVIARWMRELPAIASFVHDFPGSSALPSGSPVGIPAWLGWQHFLNMFLIVFVIRAGWQIRSGHPRLSAQSWSRKRNPKNAGSSRSPSRIGLAVWWHIVVNTLWVLNGVIFYILIFATGQWLRLVPVSWDVFPNAISVAIQYLSLDWPLDSGWVSYNGLQLIAYFVTVFVAAPLAVATGLRMSPMFATGYPLLQKWVPLPAVRKVHFWVMVWFVAFIFLHVTAVFATGALRNLNHMYASQDTEGWTGLWIFAGSLVVAIVAWVVVTPAVIRYLASLSGSLSR